MENPGIKLERFLISIKTKLENFPYSTRVGAIFINSIVGTCLVTEGIRSNLGDDNTKILGSLGILFLNYALPAVLTDKRKMKDRVFSLNFKWELLF